VYSRDLDTELHYGGLVLIYRKIKIMTVPPIDTNNTLGPRYSNRSLELVEI